MLPALITTVLFSLSAVFASHTARSIGSLAANFWRLLIGTFFLGIWAHTLGNGLKGESLTYFLFSGCVGFGFGDIAFFLALPRLGSRLTMLLTHCLAAPFAALIEWLWLGTILNRSQITCGIIVLLGVAVAIAPHDQFKLSPKNILGIFFGILSAMGQGYGAVLSRKAFETANLAGQTIDGMTSAYQRILGGLPIAFIFFIIMTLVMKRKGSLLYKAAGSRIWPWIFLNSLTGSVLGVSCYQWALSTTPSGVVLPIIATTPLAVIPLARVMEGDRATKRSLVGGVIAVLGVVALIMA